MAVLLETSKGDLVIDLYVDDAPLACKNFLKLCKCAGAREPGSAHNGCCCFWSYQ